MTTSEQFITHLNDVFDSKGLKLISDFFITFSRFECALKTSITYSNERKGKIEPDWSKFTKSIKDTFNKDRTIELKTAVEFILNNPPKYQTIEFKTLRWVEKSFNHNEPELNKLEQHIRDIRNNLFHGGKFYGRFTHDVSRNAKLIKYAILVLDEWLELNIQVRTIFLSPLN